MKRRFRKSIPLGRARQFFIQGVSLDYEDMPEAVRDRVRALAFAACPWNGEAFIEYVTTEISAESLCLKYYIGSPTTLERAMRDYYMEMDRFFTIPSGKMCDCGGVGYGIMPVTEGQHEQKKRETGEP